MSAAEPPERKIAGSMLWFNICESIFPQWNAYMQNYLPRTEPFLTYIAHGSRGAKLEEQDNHYWYASFLLWKNSLFEAENHMRS